VREQLQGLIQQVHSRSKIISIPAPLAKSILTVLDALNLVPFTAWHYRTPDKPFYFDISKAQRLLGWQPRMNNTDMLKRSYDWYVDHRKQVDRNFGSTHSKSVRQRILTVLRFFS